MVIVVRIWMMMMKYKKGSDNVNVDEVKNWSDNINVDEVQVGCDNVVNEVQKGSDNVDDKVQTGCDVSDKVQFRINNVYDKVQLVSDDKKESSDDVDYVGSDVDIDSFSDSEYVYNDDFV